jgi:hypothetical protein
MSDFRASIKIEFEFMDVRDFADMHINYCPTDCCNMDERVIAFFTRVYEEGMVAHNKMIREQYEKENKENIECVERAQLKRLKEKYEYAN